MSRIIPFPKRNDLSNVQDFPTGSQVLAVYPGTTALYKATVVNGHRKVTILSNFFTWAEVIIHFLWIPIFYRFLYFLLKMPVSFAWI